MDSSRTLVEDSNLTISSFFYSIWWHQNKLISQFLALRNLQDSVKFGWFLGGLVGSYKLILCIWRRIFKSDKPSALISGMISSLFIQFTSPKWKYNLSLLTLCRAIFTFMTKLENIGVPCKIPTGNVISFSLCSAYI